MPLVTAEEGGEEALIWAEGRSEVLLSLKINHLI